MADKMQSGFLRDAFGRLVVASAASAMALAEGEKMRSGFVRDAQKRLIVIGPEGKALGGDVTGPGAATDGDIAVFDKATGKLLKDGGKTIAAIQAEIEAAKAGLSVKQSVALATTAALPANVYVNGASGVGATLTGSAFGALEADGVAAVAGQRWLVKNEAAEAHNGIYTVTKPGGVAELYVLTRATDNDQAAEFDGAFTLVEGGKTEAGTGWTVASTGAVVVGTTAIVWTEFGVPAFENGKLKESYLPPSVVTGSVGEGSAAKGLALNTYRVQVEGTKLIELAIGEGAGKDPLRIDLTGTPANNSVTALKVAALAVQAPAIGDLGLGSLWPVTGFASGLSSFVPGALKQAWVPCKILQPCPITGIAYMVGATSNGKVAVAIYGPTGTLLKKSASAAQATAENIQRVELESVLTIPEPGTYWLSIITESATATYRAALNHFPALKETQGEFAVRGSLVVPTAPIAATAVPSLSTY